MGREPLVCVGGVLPGVTNCTGNNILAESSPSADDGDGGGSSDGDGDGDGPEWSHVSWSVPRYSRTKVDEAGKILTDIPSFSATGLEGPEYAESLEIVNNWRSSHSWPLYAVRRVLERRAKKISPSAIIAQRIKRFPSIERKLCENSARHMSLTQMQDVGGCRAIMPTLECAKALIETYRSRGMTKCEKHSERDYISTPKPDGYRSVHFVFKYRSDSPRYKLFNNQRIEIQVRSAMQHTWATAAEMLQIFAGILVREPGGVYAARLRDAAEVAAWRQFFLLMSDGIAEIEGAPTVSGDSLDVNELRRLGRYLRVPEVMWAWSAMSGWRKGSLQRLPGSMVGLADASQYLLELDPDQMRVRVIPFKPDQWREAFTAYTDSERAQRGHPSTNVVLVSVDSIDSLEAAYPNYYGDSHAFVELFRGLTGLTLEV